MRFHIRHSSYQVRYILLLLLAMIVTASCGEAPPHKTLSQKADALPPPLACQKCWHPALNTGWQYQINGTANLSVSAMLYDIDLFENSKSVVDTIHRAGHKVLCYIDAGTWENWRPDARQFPRNLKGKADEGWQGENWLDIRQYAAIQPLLEKRIALCQAKGFDGIEFDNVNGYSNNTGFPIKPHDQLLFNTWLANTAHKHHLIVALKNDFDQVTELLPYFDLEISEQCFEYQECEKLQLFIKTGKPVMEVEYNLETDAFCPQANQLNFNAIQKHLELDAYRVACR